LYARLQRPESSWEYRRPPWDALWSACNPDAMMTRWVPSRNTLVDSLCTPSVVAVAAAAAAAAAVAVAVAAAWNLCWALFYADTRHC